MFLDKIAQRGMQIHFEGFDENTGYFEGHKFLGRLAPTDRFLSIYNRPTRMRTLLVNPTEELPESGVFQHPETKEIYLLGAEREDSKWDVNQAKPYVSLIMAHEVTPNGRGTAGYCEVFRREPEGPDEDPGWAVKNSLGNFWVDMEYRTAASEKGTYDLKAGDYYSWFPSTARLKQLDSVELDGTHYQVEDAYTDMGYTAAKLSKVADPRVDLQIITQEGRTYNPSTYQYESQEVTYNVTAIVPEDQDVALWNTSKSSEIQVVIPHEYIGFEPQAGHKIVYQGRDRLVKNVETQAGVKEYKVTCA